MDTAGMAMALIRRMGGYTEEEVQVLFQAGEKRLVDLRALVHGGPLSDGTVVPGMKAVYDALAQSLQETAALRLQVAELVAIQRAKPATVAKSARPKGAPHG